VLRYAGRSRTSLYFNSDGSKAAMLVNTRASKITISPAQKQQRCGDYQSAWLAAVTIPPAGSAWGSRRRLR
jgi:hypothetical protein